MRHLRRFARSILDALWRLDDAIKRYGLIPARRWLTVQHCTALVLLLYALALVTNPSMVMVALARTLGYEHFPMLTGLLFLFCAALLFGKPVSELRYRFLTLPLFLYFWALVWYLLTFPGTSWMAAVSAFGIWLFLQIVRTEVPPDEG